jgi:hypothetical protein
MTTFPALIPSTRTYSPGEYPITPHPLLSGSEIRVRHSNTVLGVRLRLTFQAVSSADAVAVRNHYHGRQGGFLPFAIPEELLSGVTTPVDFTPAGHQWVYASRPSVVDVPIAGDTPTNRHDLVVELVTVPPENTIVAGARITVRATVRGGSAQLGAYIESFASVVGGAATVEASTSALGAAITANVSVVGGAAGGDAFVDPLTAQASVVGGAASASTAFDPLSLSPAAWWDASDTGTVATGVDGVTDWDDKSGNDRHLFQGFGPYMPSYTSSAINGLHALEWPSTDNPRSLVTAAFDVTVKEVYVVLECSTSTFSNYEGIFASRDNAKSETIGGQASGVGLQVTDLLAYVNGNNSTNMNGDVFPEIESPSLWRFVVPSSGWATTAGLVVGMDRMFNSLNRGWNGYIAEVLVFSTALSSGDRGDLETYLMDKWGIT